MQWFGKGSNNVEDGRSGGGGKTILGGGIGIIVVVLGLIFGKDLSGVVSQLPTSQGTEEVKQGVPANDPQAIFVSGVLESTEQVWDVGHHVQNILGISEKLDQARGQVSEKEYNRLSVKLELQADFFAGLWAHHAQNLKDFKLEEGDIEEALTAANAIGDDKLQKQATGDVQPDSFTHGTSQQRMFWFKKGFETGDIKQGDTFSQL
ncbi:MAG: hypothetical protein EOO86_20345 [Pedobacter sp.]|nr:MAG: hypothetical protein EOO86_20345 [Pedobacter sp.]